jgi:hypothetical protein
MKAMLRVITAEMLRMKRTLALWLAFVGPLVVVGFVLLSFVGQGEASVESLPDSAWIEFVQMVNIFWALLVLPLFATLQTALLAGVEHQNEQWKHLYALPVPRWAVVAAKQVAAAALMGLSHAALLAFTVLGGHLLWLLRPDLGFHVAVPWPDLVKPVGVIYLASGLILTIHTWIGLRWRNFAVASAAGIVLTVAGMFAINSRWGSYYPWALAGGIINALHKGEPFRLAEFLFGALGGAAVAPLACWDLVRRDVL